MTLDRRFYSGVSAIHAASLGKQNLTKPSALSISSPAEKTFLKGSKMVVIAMWNPALVLAALLPFGNLGRRARRRTALADCFFQICLGILPTVMYTGHALWFPAMVVRRVLSEPQIIGTSVTPLGSFSCSIHQ
jgi:hypothetical protein